MSNLKNYKNQLFHIKIKIIQVNFNLNTYYLILFHNYFTIKKKSCKKIYKGER
jgi:hypothetical protein